MARNNSDTNSVQFSNRRVDYIETDNMTTREAMEEISDTHTGPAASPPTGGTHHTEMTAAGGTGITGEGDAS